EETIQRAERSAREKRPDAFDAWKRARTASGGAPRTELAAASFLLRRNHVAEALAVLRPLAAAPGLEGEPALEARFRLAEALLRARPPLAGEAREELAKLVAA